MTIHFMQLVTADHEIFIIKYFSLLAWATKIKNTYYFE